MSSTISILHCPRILSLEVSSLSTGLKQFGNCLTIVNFFLNKYCFFSVEKIYRSNVILPYNFNIRIFTVTKSL